MLIRNINAAVIRQPLDNLNETATYKNELLCRVKALLRWGYKHDYIESVEFLNKLEKYEDYSKKERLEDKYLEEDEIKWLPDDMSDNDTWYHFTKFLILSGLRIGEAIALTDKDLVNDFIHVNKTYDKNNDIINETPKTDSSNRDVYMQNELKQCITDYKHCRKVECLKSRYLFCNPCGDHIAYDSYRQYLHDHSKKALGRVITPHTLRHTHASLLIANGVNLDAIARRLGHANSNITRQIYIHIMDRLKKCDQDKLQELKIL